MASISNRQAHGIFESGFTLCELVVVTAILGLLASMLLPGLGRAKAKARRAVCLDNLHQINLAATLYAEDHQDAIVLPSRSNPTTDFQLYKQFVKSYAGYKGRPSPSEKLFACPSDSFYYSAGSGAGQYHGLGLCEQSFTDFTSYAFNGGNRRNTNYPGIAGVRLGSVVHPARTLFILEAAAMAPFSWHNPQDTRGDYRIMNSMNMAGHVDGHVNSLKMFCPTNSHAEAWQHDPPAGYDYQWSAD